MRFLATHIALAASLTCLLPIAARGQTPVRFSDVGAELGIAFRHDNGGARDKHLPETMGAGVAWIDYDNDGRSDLYFVQSGGLPGTSSFEAARQPGNVMYRNGRAGFAPVAGIAADQGYGMGVTAGDYDNDGRVDLFVTNFGANALYRNNGDGTFSRVEAGVEDERWSVSAAWGDLDGDGDLDLFVTNYVAYDVAEAVRCGEQVKSIVSYCHIDLFDGREDSLYRNEGNGTFTDIAVAAGVANAHDGKGLGVVMADLDIDGQTDIYVANDTQQNFFYLNQGGMRFLDDGLISGTGYSPDGDAQAGMGTAAADLDGDGTTEILVTNFAFEANNVYRQVAPGMYLDETYALGFGERGLVSLAFGIVALDADGDGDREVAVANGHILDNAEEVFDGTTYAQANHLFVSSLAQQRAVAVAGGRLAPGDTAWRVPGRLFEELSDRAGSGFTPVEVSRGLAVGDIEGDGRPDLVFTNSAGPARLLHNDGAAGRQRLVLRLRGRAGSRDAYGARVVVTPTGGAHDDGATGFAQVAEVRSASSYCSQDSSDLMFGLGTSPRALISIRWLDGTQQQLEVPAGQMVLVREGIDAPITRALAGS